MSFIERGGKRKVDVASAKSTPVAVAKWHSVAIAPVAPLMLTAFLSTPCPPEQGAFYPLSVAMLIN